MGWLSRHGSTRDPDSARATRIDRGKLAAGATFRGDRLQRVGRGQYPGGNEGRGAVLVLRRKVSGENCSGVRRGRLVLTRGRPYLRSCVRASVRVRDRECVCQRGGEGGGETEGGRKGGREGGRRRRESTREERRKKDLGVFPLYGVYGGGVERVRRAPRSRHRRLQPPRPRKLREKPCTRSLSPPSLTILLAFTFLFHTHTRLLRSFFSCSPRSLLKLPSFTPHTAFESILKQPPPQRFEADCTCVSWTACPPLPVRVTRSRTRQHALCVCIRVRARACAHTHFKKQGRQ